MACWRAALLSLVCLALLRGSAGARVAELDASNFEAEVSAHPAYLVVFHAPWCAHCKAVEPVLNALAAKNVPVSPRAPERAATPTCRIVGRSLRRHGAARARVEVRPSRGRRVALARPTSQVCRQRLPFNILHPQVGLARAAASAHEGPCEGLCEAVQKWSWNGPPRGFFGPTRGAGGGATALRIHPESADHYVV
ncbi:hypothetical protein M885DRAFT_120303 [Pelagophyceae sp. CCMP2097]|nr:hypothetical protein M885DRAFT_120303 [Pelagophyceae sp. CCMP2097]